MLRPFIALLATVLLLALPGVALAQSAGDDQYADPLSGSQDQPSNSGQDNGDQPTDDVGSTPAPTAPAPESAPTGAETTAGATPSAGATLPRTGYDVVLLFAAAFPLLLGGLTLRRVAS